MTETTLPDNAKLAKDLVNKAEYTEGLKLSLDQELQLRLIYEVKAIKSVVQFFALLVVLWMVYAFISAIGAL